MTVVGNCIEGTQPCHNVPAGGNSGTFSQFFAAYLTLDFTASAAECRGTSNMLPITPITLQNSLTGLGSDFKINGQWILFTIFYYICTTRDKTS